MSNPVPTILKLSAVLLLFALPTSASAAAESSMVTPRVFHTTILDSLIIFGHEGEVVIRDGTPPILKLGLQPSALARLSKFAGIHAGAPVLLRLGDEVLSMGYLDEYPMMLTLRTGGENEPVAEFRVALPHRPLGRQDIEGYKSRIIRGDSSISVDFPSAMPDVSRQLTLHVIGEPVHISAATTLNGRTRRMDDTFDIRYDLTAEAMRRLWDVPGHNTGTELIVVVGTKIYSWTNLNDYGAGSPHVTLHTIGPRVHIKGSFDHFFSPADLEILDKDLRSAPQMDQRYLQVDRGRGSDSMDIEDCRQGGYISPDFADIYADQPWVLKRGCPEPFPSSD